jgi:hypothetical protein
LKALGTELMCWLIFIYDRPQIKGYAASTRYAIVLDSSLSNKPSALKAMPIPGDCADEVSPDSVDAEHPLEDVITTFHYFTIVRRFS